MRACSGGKSCIVAGFCAGLGSGIGAQTGRRSSLAAQPLTTESTAMSTPCKTVRLTYPDCASGLDVQAVMLDLDGTLVNTLGDFDLALNGMLAENHWPQVEPAFIARTVGKGSPYLIRQTLLHVGLGRDGVVDEALYARAHASYQQHYSRINGQASHLYAGVRQGLEQLHAAGLLLACITNKPTQHARDLLQQLGVAHYFACVHGGDFFARRKPDPLPLLETARMLGCAPAQALMVGDSVNDSEAAHGAGCPVLLVRYGYNHGEPIEGVPAQGYLHSLAELRCGAQAGLRPGCV